MGRHDTTESVLLADCLRGVDSKELVMFQGSSKLYEPIVETVSENEMET
ncbi:unnamed protein product, partial [Allacma fusca]